jgi:hypothetical protein
MPTINCRQVHTLPQDTVVSTENFSEKWGSRNVLISKYLQNGARGEVSAALQGERFKKS